MSLLDSAGRIASADWLSGASLPVGLAPVLGSDVVFPSQQRFDGRLTFIDRLGLDRVSAAPLATPTERVVSFSALGKAQDAPQPTSAYRPNPQDAYRLDDGTWLVTRPEPRRGTSNHDVGPAQSLSTGGEGDDVVRIDPANGRILGRLDLSSMRDEGLWARPTRFAELDDSMLAVGLWHLSGDYRHAGPGRIALFDSERMTLSQRIELAPLVNCGEVAVYNDTLFVLCRGTPFGTRSERQTSAGLVQLAWNNGQLEERRRFHARVPSQAPSLGLLPLSHDRVVFVAEGDLRAAETDTLFSYDFSTETTTHLYQSRAAFTLGAPVADDDSLFLPLANEGLVVLPLSPAHTEPVSAMPTTCRKLPLRALSWLPGS